MTDMRVLSNYAWTLLQTQSSSILAFDTPDYDTPTGSRWWVYYPSGGDRLNDRTGGISTALTWSFDLICVGRTVEQCLWVAGKADTLLIGTQLDPADPNSYLYPQPNGARVLPESGDPIGARFSLNRQYRLNTRS